jgi:hypothetical protein
MNEISGSFVCVMIQCSQIITLVLHVLSGSDKRPHPISMTSSSGGFLVLPKPRMTVSAAK